MQGARVGMARRVKESASIGGFDDTTGIHNLDAVAETGDDPEIMRDEHNRHAQFPLHFFDQLENLRLHRDIEGGGRFVGDENLGFGDERHGDHYALSHAAGEFVRVIMNTLGRIVDADGIKHRKGAAEGIATGNLFVNEKRLDELFADPQVRIERGHRILENHGDALASDRSGFRRRAVEEVYAVKHRRTAYNVTRGLRNEAHDGVTSNGLTGAGFADDTERLASFDAEADAIDGAVDAVAGVEVSAKIVDGEEGHAFEEWLELGAESNCSEVSC